MDIQAINAMSFDSELEKTMMHLYRNAVKLLPGEPSCFDADHSPVGPLMIALSHTLSVKKKRHVDDFEAFMPLAKEIAQFLCQHPYKNEDLLDVCLSLIRFNQLGTLELLVPPNLKQDVLKRIADGFVKEDYRRFLIESALTQLGIEGIVKAESSDDLFQSLDADTIPFVFAQGEWFDAVALRRLNEVISYYTQLNFKLPKPLFAMFKELSLWLMEITNEHGYGLPYGRHIDFEGDVILGETLSLALRLNILPKSRIREVLSHLTALFDSSKNPQISIQSTSNHCETALVDVKQVKQMLRKINILNTVLAIDNEFVADQTSQDENLNFHTYSLRNQNEIMMFILYRKNGHRLVLPLISGDISPTFHCRNVLDPIPFIGRPDFTPHIVVQGRTWEFDGPYMDIKIMGEGIQHIDFKTSLLKSNDPLIKVPSIFLHTHIEVHDKEIMTDYLFSGSDKGDINVVNFVFPFRDSLLDFQTDDESAHCFFSGTIKEFSLHGFSYIETSTHDDQHGLSHPTIVEASTDLPTEAFGWRIKINSD